MQRTGPSSLQATLHDGSRGPAFAELRRGKLLAPPTVLWNPEFPPHPPRLNPRGGSASLRHVRVSIVTTAAVWLLLGLPVSAEDKPSVPAAVVAVTNAAGETESPFERVVVLGASLSAGFTLAEPLGGTDTFRYSLASYVEVSLPAGHPPLRNFSSAYLFLRPEPTGRRQIARALEVKPTLAIAVDYLFWFCYGNFPVEGDRLKSLETGLAQLDQLSCPIIVGDIPDASGAANGMLYPSQIPQPATLLAANQRVREWAAKRGRVAVVPLFDFMRAAMADEPVKVRDREWRAGETRAFIQPDKLHPSAAGCAALAVAVNDAILTLYPDIAATNFCWDAKELLRRVNTPGVPAGRKTSNIQGTTTALKVADLQGRAPDAGASHARPVPRRRTTLASIVNRKSPGCSIPAFRRFSSWECDVRVSACPNLWSSMKSI